MNLSTSAVNRDINNKEYGEIVCRMFVKDYVMRRHINHEEVLKADHTVRFSEWQIIQNEDKIIKQTPVFSSAFYTWTTLYKSDPYNIYRLVCV